MSGNPYQPPRDPMAAHAFDPRTAMLWFSGVSLVTITIVAVSLSLGDPISETHWTVVLFGAAGVITSASVFGSIAKRAPLSETQAQESEELQQYLRDDRSYTVGTSITVMTIFAIIALRPVFSTSTKIDLFVCILALVFSTISARVAYRSLV